MIVLLFLALFSYLEKKFETLASHKSLKSEILQAFREIGNAIMLVKCLEDCLVCPA